MANKQPALQFYIADWLRSKDVQKATWATRGIWAEMLFNMWDASEQGKLSGSWPEITRLIGCTIDELKCSLEEIKRLKIGNVTMRNGNVTVINRRMYKEYKEREATRLRVKRHRKKSKKLS